MISLSFSMIPLVRHVYIKNEETKGPLRVREPGKVVQDRSLFISRALTLCSLLFHNLVLILPACIVWCAANSEIRDDETYREICIDI